MKAGSLNCMTLTQTVMRLFLRKIGANSKAYEPVALTPTDFDRVVALAVAGRSFESPSRGSDVNRTIATVLLAFGLVPEWSLAADGPTAPYNEAVKIVNGKRVVEVAPFPAHMKFAVGNFKRPDEHAPMQGDLAAIETPQGLMDCSGTLWFHPKACSPSTFGREKRFRTWIVLMDRRWFACGSYSSAKTCVPIIADGKLRPIPSTEE